MSTGLLLLLLFPLSHLLTSLGGPVTWWREGAEGL